MLPPTISRTQLIQHLQDLGVKSGGVLLVHCAFSQVRPIEDGPLGLITALRTVLGPDGTLVMPSMTDDKDMPFDPRQTPCKGMGIVADTFWRQPQVRRSDSPHAFAAQGIQAAWITTPHPVDVPHGLDSPVGRVYELDGQVLLLGMDHRTNTTIHLAELLAGVRYRRQKSSIVGQGRQLERIHYGEIDHCCQNFPLVDDWLAAKHQQHRGLIGYAEARLIRSHDIIDVVTAQLRANETAFLHPLGVDEQCDEARAILENSK
ncbi:MAG: AAC(3) family N-acetyltransferase [Chloroflexota bacterium]